jgi:DMSO reductase family type II enzyme heme b subunit
MRMRRPGTFALLGACGIALVLTLTDTRLATSQEAVLTARLSRDVPARAPWDPFWSDVPSAEIPLSAQAVTPPKGGRALTLTVRAVHDGTDLYVLVEWSDSTPDRSLGRTQDFSDAAAVEFPESGTTQVPAFCMGDPAAGVNIWHWRAAWQADVERAAGPAVARRYPDGVVDDYPFADDPSFAPARALGNPVADVARTSAADNLIAAGFGTLTADPLADVQGWGVWRDGLWRVVFSRPLAVDLEGNVQLNPDTWTDMAFAVWDGAAEERDGVKSVANFVTLNLEPDPLTPDGGVGEWPLLAILAAWVLIAAYIASDLPRAR